MLGGLFNRLRYFWSDAWDECRHSVAVNVLALGTLSSALFVAGLVMLIVANVDRRIQGLRDEVRIDIFLHDDHDRDQIRALANELERIDGVDRVEYVDKQEALRRYREWAAGMADLVNELETNPLPASLEVFFDPGASATASAEVVRARVERAAGIEEIRFRQQLLVRLQAMLDVARIGGGGIATLVLGAVVFVMASVLRLAVYSRREEIEIMQLVGATPGFIRGPFLVAGALQGLAASAIALLLVEIVRRAARIYGGRGSAVLLDLFASTPLPANLALLLAVLGMLVSVTGAYFAVRRSV